MIPLVVRFVREPDTTNCGLCHQPVLNPSGMQLALADSQEPVCHSCGRRHQPALAALIQLADEAERISRIGRHMVVPPYTALLELAQAAEHYAAHSSSVRELG